MLSRMIYRMSIHANYVSQDYPLSSEPFDYGGNLFGPMCITTFYDIVSTSTEVQ